jgi:hypothetical protein
MKLPRLNAAYIDTPQGFYAGSAAIAHAGVPASSQVDMSGILDTIKDIAGGLLGKVPCVLSAAGPKGLSCLTTCGPNPACLAACAGPALVSAILGCL